MLLDCSAPKVSGFFPRNSMSSLARLTFERSGRARKAERPCPLGRVKTMPGIQIKGYICARAPLFSLPIGWIFLDVNGYWNCRISSLTRSNWVYGLISDYVRIVLRGRRSFVASRLSAVCFMFAGALCRVSSAMKPQVVFVLGGPGAGKGTQCAKIVQVWGGDKELFFGVHVVCCFA